MGGRERTAEKEERLEQQKNDPKNKHMLVCDLQALKVLRIPTLFLRSLFSCHASASLAACLCLGLVSRLPDPVSPAVVFMCRCLQASSDPLVSSDEQVLNSHSFIPQAGGILEMSNSALSDEAEL